MKERMTLCELKNYFQNHSVARVIFCTENQNGDEVDCTLSQTLIFNHISAESRPNKVVLSEGKNSICFHHVQCVYIDETRTILGTVLDIICDTASEREKIYTLVIQE